MLTPHEAELRVATGAAHLDAIRPGWFHQIDVGTLSLGSCTDCILGQLFREHENDRMPFAVGLKALGWWHTDAEQHGVAGLDSADTVRMTQDAWIAAIADRKLNAEMLTPVEVSCLTR